MCGIFGCVIRNQLLSPQQIKTIIDKLFIASEARGKEACGLAIKSADKLSIYKTPLRASKMIKRPRYLNFLQQSLFADAQLQPGYLSFIGHSRLVTHGREGCNQNNQPQNSTNHVMVHNGIIVNHEQLWQKHTDIEQQTQVDTELAVKLFEKYVAQSQHYGSALKQLFDEVDGSASIACLSRESDSLVLATNTGSLYFIFTADFLVFASEAQILRSVLKSAPLSTILAGHTIQQCKPSTAKICSYSDSIVLEHLHLQQVTDCLAINRVKTVDIIDLSAVDDPSKKQLTRCSRCILPSTMPYIEFNHEGVCNYCQRYQDKQYQGLEALEKELAPHRKSNGEADCIVAFSGGRDSSYGLHLLKNELDMNPIAFTYDWGLVTDIARRNQARMCGRLGVEHILISANIKKKRRNVRNNILAWAKRPHLGMIPLFMAGDKQFFYYANKLRKQFKIKPIVFFTNPLEKTSFKTGFCNIRETSEYSYTLPLMKHLDLLRFYCLQYLKNPSYVNSSLVDVFLAYLSTYTVEKHSHILPYEYFPWDEAEVEKILIEQYDWETDSRDNLVRTWRIGDGTAAFYNYIYYSVAGFTEYDTFRSNQIRAGLMTRSEALARVQVENKPDWYRIQEYANTVGFNLDEVINAVSQMPRLYDPV